jgi:hypothetical protein
MNKAEVGLHIQIKQKAFSVFFNHPRQRKTAVELIS